MLKLFQITNFALRSRGVIFKTFTPQTPITSFNFFKLQFSEETTTKSKINESVKKNKRMRVLSSDEETEEEVVKS